LLLGILYTNFLAIGKNHNIEYADEIEIKMNMS
jgi:hypothetical protein